MPQAEKQKKIRKITGVVVSDKMMKTRVVAVSRLKKHPRYLKYQTLTRASRRMTRRTSITRATKS